MTAAYDFLVVGAGFAGAVLAERLASQADRRVMVVDRRAHVAGNAYDFVDEHGVLIHKYGPHIFHTNSERVFNYLSQFTEWTPYEHRVLASVDGKLVPIPINLTTLELLYERPFTPEAATAFLAERAEPRERIETSEDIVVSKIGRELYEKFFQGYTRKQWGLDPSELDASVAGRVPTRVDRDDRYFTDVYQAMPRDGYTVLFERMLSHPNITLSLETDHRDVPPENYDGLIYTGPIDAYFDYCYGKLPYRSLSFSFEHLKTDCHQPAGTINHPNDHTYTRVTEFKHLTGQRCRGTTLCYEFPQPEGDPYYPVPRTVNADTYERYRQLADTIPNVHFVGRLATYRYYNMDQVVAQALAMFQSLHPGD